MNQQCAHDWTQTLPIRENVLRCKDCGYTKLMGSGTIPPRRTESETLTAALRDRFTGTRSPTHPYYRWQLDQDRRCQMGDWSGYRP